MQVTKTSLVVLFVAAVLVSSVNAGLLAPKSPQVDLVNGDFEQGPTGWTVTSTQGQDVIVSPLTFPPPHSGSWIASFGDAGGMPLNETASIAQPVTVPLDRSVLAYWHWIASLGPCGTDSARVLIDEVAVNVYDLCMDVSAPWALHTVDLETYAGQTVTLTIQVSTDAFDPSALAVDDVSFISAPQPTYLPLILKRYPPIPDVPTLHPISKNCYDDYYVVDWDSADLGTSYQLQEDDNPSFSGPLPLYDGPLTSHTVSNQPAGTWYYRVRACNTYGCSGWSNVRSITILPPQNLIVNGDFEAGRPPTPWVEYSSHNVDIVSAGLGFGDSWGAVLGYNADSWEYVEQAFVVPAGTAGADLSFHWMVDSIDEETEAWDYFYVTLRDASGNWLRTLMTADNTDPIGQWFYPTIAVDLCPYEGQTVRLRLEAELDESYWTVFVADDVALWTGQ